MLLQLRRSPRAPAAPHTLGHGASVLMPACRLGPPSWSPFSPSMPRRWPVTLCCRQMAASSARPSHPSPLGYGRCRQEVRAAAVVVAEGDRGAVLPPRLQRRILLSSAWSRQLPDLLNAVGAAAAPAAAAAAGSVAWSQRRSGD